MTDTTPICRMPCGSIVWLFEEAVKMRVALIQISNLRNKPVECVELFSDAMKIAREAIGTDER